MTIGDQEAPARKKIQAVFSGLDDYFLERHRLNLTDASSLASGIEKPKKEELKDGEIAEIQKLTQKLKREINTVLDFYKDKLSS